MTGDYELSENLFLDIWKKYNSPSELTNKSLINDFLSDLVISSKGWIIMDHYSNINFDNIKRIETDGNYTKILWKDFNNYRQKHLNQTLSENDLFTWQIFGYYTYQYALMDISKLKFIKIRNHLFILLQANLVTQKEFEKFLLDGNELISKHQNTEELYTEYIFFEGEPSNLIKHSCIFGNLPYYSIIIQPKENCSASSAVSKQLMLYETLKDIQFRLENTYEKILSTSENDYDELFSKGNTIRRILEFALKHYCVWSNIHIEIESKYGYIELGKLKKSLKEETIDLPQKLINIANELSHDSGVSFSKNDIVCFYNDVNNLIIEISQIINNNPHRII